jgi:hypothetical protein
MDEAKFTTKFVIPLLRKIGFSRIRYTHGSDEYGRDVIFFDKDRFGMPMVCACQVKIGDIKGTQKRKIQEDIVPQLLEGINTSYKDIETGEIHKIQRMYLIISGTLKGTAKEQINSRLGNEPNIFLLDFQSLDVLSCGDGYETFFMFRSPGSKYSYPAGLRHVPRLPIMQSGMSLSILIDLKKYGYTESARIIDVSYNPIIREQNITLELPLNDGVEDSDTIRDLASIELERYFDYAGLYLAELIEDELELSANRGENSVQNGEPLKWRIEHE